MSDSDWHHKFQDRTFPKPLIDALVGQLDSVVLGPGHSGPPVPGNSTSPIPRPPNTSLTSFCKPPLRRGPLTPSSLLGDARNSSNRVQSNLPSATVPSKRNIHGQHKVDSFQGGRGEVDSRPINSPLAQTLYHTENLSKTPKPTLGPASALENPQHNLAANSFWGHHPAYYPAVPGANYITTATPQMPFDASLSGQAPSGFESSMVDIRHAGSEGKKMKVGISVEEGSYQAAIINLMENLKKTYTPSKLARLLSLPVLPVPVQTLKEQLTPFGPETPIGYTRFRIKSEPNGIADMMIESLVFEDDCDTPICLGKADCEKIAENSTSYHAVDHSRDRVIESKISVPFEARLESDIEAQELNDLCPDIFLNDNQKVDLGQQRYASPATHGMPTTPTTYPSHLSSFTDPEFSLGTSFSNMVPSLGYPSAGTMDQRSHQTSSSPPAYTPVDFEENAQNWGSYFQH